MEKLRIGVDLGGTKIRAVGISTTPELRLLADAKVMTVQSDGYDAILTRIVETVREVERQLGISLPSIGIGTPGVIDANTSLLKNSNTLCLNGMPLQQDLASLLKKEVLLQNDANCFAVAEHLLGAARGSTVSFGVIMGTGVGGGVVINGKPRYGLQGIAGEWGHNVVEHGGVDCYCGKKGCVETVISGPAIERFYTSLSGTSRSLIEIRELSIAEERHAVAAMDRLLEKFAQAIAVVINIIDPDCIVLGGGVSNIPELYSEGIERTKKYIFNNTPTVRIVKNELGDSAGVFGAAMLT